MSSAGTRERKLPLLGFTQLGVLPPSGSKKYVHPDGERVLAEGKQITVSESHRLNRKTGLYDGGGPFYTSRIGYFNKPAYVSDAFLPGNEVYYSGPLNCALPSLAEIEAVGQKSPQFGDKNESQMKVDGTNAISYSNPVNPASNLGTTLAEMFREGAPSLPGIQSWKNRAAIAKAAGSEYLNYEFGWAPLKDEVTSVGNAARQHANIMRQYQHNEGKDTHRRFDYPLQSSVRFGPTSESLPVSPLSNSWFASSERVPRPRRQVKVVTSTKRWFEGCFTYGLPSSSDSWKRALGFGSKADQLFGIALSPDVLWELTPWSWAVDWFSNAGEVINNVTNFGLAGLVMRYGFMMEETSIKVTAELGRGACWSTPAKAFPFTLSLAEFGPSSSGYEVVTKRRVPASPFGFSIGWEGLSPTQLAITAALGITRLL